MQREAADIIPTVVERYHAAGNAPVFLCDFSPPRGADSSLLDPARTLDADFLCVAYNPGKSVRVDSAFVGGYLQDKLNKSVLFNLATRDMNKLALQSHLLGAHLLGLRNVLVLHGDDFSEKERAQVKSVYDFKSTELVASIAAMNAGNDFRGQKLRQPTAFCIGVSVDLNRLQDAEAKLAHRKVQAGAHFLVTQLVFGVEQAEAFQSTYARVAGHPLSVPIFYGLPVLEEDSLTYGDMPGHMRRDLEAGRSGADIALDLFHQLRQHGIRGFYVIPPILRGGLRNYQAAADFLAKARAEPA
ncbi:MAG: hypothetical protein EXR67_06920 [Dehalococcoidia bacterium]|nr:hypothetical protein [Dehalococcoidia bacterium]